MAVRVLALRRPDACSACGAPLPAGTRAQSDTDARAVTCLPCAATPRQANDVASSERTPEPAPVLVRPGSPDGDGTAVIGIGAMRDRLPAQSVIEQVLRMQETMPPRGRRAKVFGVSPLHRDAVAWYAGATGELRVAALLGELPPPWTVLHSLPVGNNEADIDHLVVGPPGVFTINTKHHAGKRVWVGGRTVMVSGQRQPYVGKAEAEGRQVRRLLSRRCLVPAPVRPVIAVVGARSVIVRTPPREVTVLTAHRLPAWLQRQQPVLDHAGVGAIVEALDQPDAWRPTADIGAAAALKFMALREEVATAHRRRLLWLLALIPGVLIVTPTLLALLLAAAAAATRL